MSDSAADGADLVTAAKRLADGGRRARLWIDQVRTQAVSVANEAHGLTSATRRAENLARKLAGAAGRRNCVGVFGPSQAGKSYLVSALARRPMGQLRCDFAGVEKDFLTEINPPGDRESTGLVTRFTAGKTAADPEHPVELRLLSETDLVKIFANSFFSDFDPNNMAFKLPDEAAIRAAVAAAQVAAGSTPATHLDEITLYDLGEYFQRNFSARIDALNRAGYWDGVIAVAGRLSLAQRGQLFSMLWGGLDAFTQLFVDLARGLERLGFAQEARAELAALMPREKGIIDVAILRFLNTPEDAADAIAVRPAGAEGPTGPAVKVPRALLTALVAELKIVMTDSPWPFFAHTDLLDFPGARSRLKLTNLPADAAERTAQVRELLLRGKIAYLFQRFTEERELTAMLLCMPPSVAEVKDLASMVKSWIDLTHGPTAKLRAGVRNALFLILTKFDLEFLEKGGETAESRKGKWDRRLHASLLELYGKDGWTDDWDGRPFGNTLFLRNPGMKQEHLIDYQEILKEKDGSERLIEAGPAVKRAALIEEYHQAFTASALVRKHFDRLEETWAAAFQPNDGGVSFLVARLGEVLDPDLKKQQIGERLREEAGRLDDSLRRFYHAADDASRREKEQALLELRRGLFAAMRAHAFAGFAHLLEGLLVRERDVREIFLNVAALRATEAPAAPPPAAAADPWADDPWAVSAPAAAAAPPPPAATDRPAMFATQVMNHWTEALRRLSQQPGVLQTLALEARLVDDLVQEVIVGAHRLALAEQIASGVRRQVQSANVRWDDVADRAALIATAAINDYVAYLGYGALPEAERPGFPEPPKQRTRAIFAAPPNGSGLPTLGPSRLPLEQGLFLDWGVALRQLGLDNVSFGGGREIDEAQNRALGEILDVIAIGVLIGNQPAGRAAARN